MNDSSEHFAMGAGPAALYDDKTPTKREFEAERVYSQPQEHKDDEDLNSDWDMTNNFELSENV